MSDKSLNEIMEFGHVVYVDDNGNVSSAKGVYAPDVDDESVSYGWTLLSGFTGQYGYNGPHMHASEFIGGGLEDHIRSHPGYYVAVVAECDHKPEYECDPYDIESGSCEPLGWVVAYRETLD